ncbi:TGF-beta-activated kinase 1 and MAP3K7-binding protein 2 [Trichonephila clavata]|uniref:TGF-beta-activated kinase 1 and MAP3K7-binding protein 2 n=2 Tax=Trichonephila clavata TaxID=2740835 RepID=A0A8X6FWD6_TRICU|nr:TGF-beta-activated kinase 1 and MAP3K7-binding protein 2 [Trichonephila clavata]
MASRNIANMHLFLEMKKKFPDLPEDMLRNHVILYAQDQDKCISLLQKHSKSHFHSSQAFSDIRLSDSKMKSKKNIDLEVNCDQETESSNINAIIWQNNKNNNTNIGIVGKESFNIPSHISNKNNVDSNAINLSTKSSYLNAPLKPEVQSAPVFSNNDRPFTDIYKSAPVSSHTALCHIPNNQNADNRMMFSTTKEHTILPLEPSVVKESSTNSSDSCEIEPSKRHAVCLSITPSFPFSQQPINVHGSSVCTSHSSRPGRHTTSLNLQLQPQSSDAYPVEISTIPTNIGSPCNYRDFGSHLQISVGSQGATFTALRLQRPHVPQSQHSPNQLPVTNQASFNVSQPSSQAQDSKGYKFPTHLQEVSNSVKENSELFHEKNRYAVDKLSKIVTNKEHCISNIKLENLLSENKIPSKHLNEETNFLHGYQASPDYILAVKKHQKARLDLVQDELNKEKSICSNLKFEINKLEQDIAQRQEKKISFSYAELLQKLKEENRKLTLECNDLIMEYDISSKEQIPLGVTDEDFYSNIFTGPNDGLTCHSKREKYKKHVPHTQDKLKSSYSDDDDDEKNHWKCKNCTFANHPALQKCEMCELPKNSGSFFCDS